MSSTIKFQSAPGFLAGRNARVKELACSVCDVSIRSRLFGREKLSATTTTSNATMFQSAPGFLAGRND